MMKQIGVVFILGSTWLIHGVTVAAGEPSSSMIQVPPKTGKLSNTLSPQPSDRASTSFPPDHLDQLATSIQGITNQTDFYRAQMDLHKAKVAALGQNRRYAQEGLRTGGRVFAQEVLGKNYQPLVEKAGRDTEARFGVNPESRDSLASHRARWHERGANISGILAASALAANVVFGTIAGLAEIPYFLPGGQGFLLWSVNNVAVPALVAGAGYGANVGFGQVQRSQSRRYIDKQIENGVTVSLTQEIKMPPAP